MQNKSRVTHGKCNFGIHKDVSEIDKNSCTRVKITLLKAMTYFERTLNQAHKQELYRATSWKVMMFLLRS